jgi:hypothetical protein
MGSYRVLLCLAVAFAASVTSPALAHADSSHLTEVSLRASGAAGPFESQDYGGASWRLGFDGEYWLTHNLGVGLQLAHQEMASVDFCFGGPSCSGANADRTSFAVSGVWRGNNPASYPLVAVGAGVAVGGTHAFFSCDSCTGADSSFDDYGSGWAAYATATTAWMFRVGGASPSAAGAVLIGPIARGDLYAPSGAGPNVSFAAYTVTFGVAVGVDLARN